MATEMRPARPLNSLNLTIVTLERFFYAMQTVAENDLWDEAEEYLKSRGCESLAISLEPILAIQAMLRNQRTAELGEDFDGERTGKAGRVDKFIASACGTPPHYPPRPPDEWPEGPWDPPQMQE